MAGPLMIGTLGQMGMSVVDTLLVGNLGEDALATVATANLWCFSMVMVGTAVLRGLEPVAAQAMGAGDRQAGGEALARALILSVLLTPALAAAILLARPMLGLLGQPPALLDGAHAFALAFAWVAPFAMPYTAIRQFLTSVAEIRPTVAAVLLANVVNAAVGAFLIYGPPKLGFVGAAWATVVAHAALLGFTAWLGRAPLRAWWPQRPAEGWAAPRAIWRIFALGAPLAMQVALEVWAFNAAGILMGWLGKLELAAHSIILNLSSVAFMVPLSISIAAATRVGNLIGAGLPWRRAAWTAVGMGAGIMAISASLFVLFPSQLVALYTRPEDAAVRAMGVGLLPIAAAFQLFDGTQVVSFGVLRGAGDVRVPSLANVVGFWLVGLPAGWWLASRHGFGAQGVWIGLALGLAIVAVLLVVRIAFTIRRGGYRVTA